MIDQEKISMLIAYEYNARGRKAIRQAKKFAKLSKIPLIGRLALRKAGDLFVDAVLYFELESIAMMRASKAKQ